MSCVIAKLIDPFAGIPIELQLVIPPETKPGEDVLAPRLLPNLPPLLAPHEYNRPSSVNATHQGFASPEQITLFQFVIPPTTVTGEDFGVVVLSPNCPQLFAPHAYMIPSSVIACEQL